MTAEQLRTALFRRWRLIAVLAICIGVGALVASQFMTRQYRAFALIQVVVNPANPNPSYVLGGDSLVATENQLATSPTLLATVAKQYTDLTASQLAAEVQAVPYGNTTLMQIVVLDASPTRAAALANDIAEQVIVIQEQTREQQNALSLKSDQDKLAALQKDIENTTANLQTLPKTPENANQIARLQAHLNIMQQLDAQLEQTIANIEIEQALKGFTLQLAQPAQPDYTPVRPIVVANVLGGIISGVLLGVLLVIAVELRDLHSLVTARFLADSDIPLLAALNAHADPYASNQDARRDAATPIPARSEWDAYRRVQLALELWSIERPVRVLAISGIGVNELASSIAAQFAVSLATSGEAVLLLEAQTLHPSQARRFGIQGEHGLNSAVLAFRAPVASPGNVTQFMYAANTVDAPALRIMPAGSPWPNGQRILGSTAITHVLEASLTSGARRIVIDAPACLHSSATQTIAGKSDGILLVIDPARDRKDQLLRAQSALASAGIRILGCILARRSMVDDDAPTNHPAAPRATQHVSHEGSLAPVSVNGFSASSRQPDHT